MSGQLSHDNLVLKLAYICEPRRRIMNQRKNYRLARANISSDILAGDQKKEITTLNTL